MRTVLIDTDTASDDALALIMALRPPNVRVAAGWFRDHGFVPVHRRAHAEHAADAMISVAEANPGLEFIRLGPLTNFAMALRRCPAFAANISRCVVMGGAPRCEGNVTPAAEFNLWVDPDAATMCSILACRSRWWVVAAVPGPGGPQ